MLSNLLHKGAVALVVAVPAFLLHAMPASAQKETPKEKLDQLYNLAKSEGEVIWAASTPSPSIAAVFGARFPGIKLTAIHLPAPQLVPRLLTESAAKRVSIDVGTGSLGRARPLNERDLFVVQDYTGTGVDPKDVIVGGRLVIVNDIMGGWIYNVRNVAPADVPRAHDDLLKPRFKGKIAIEQRASGSTLWNAMPKDEMTAYLGKIRQQGPIFLPVNQALDRVARGESDITQAVSFNTAVKAKQQGAPIDIAPVSPIYNSIQGLFTIKGLQHPNAAKLFIVWATGTEEGRKALADSDIGRYTKCGPKPIEQWLCDKNVEIYAIDTLEKAALDDELEPLKLKALGIEK